MDSRLEGLFRLTALQHEQLGVVTVVGPDDITAPLYLADGTPDGVQRLHRPTHGLGRDLRKGHWECRNETRRLLADPYGALWLAGKLPAEPIPLPPGSSLEHLAGLDRMPFSAVSAVAVTSGLVQLCQAALWCGKLDTLRRYGGVPILGLAGVDLDVLRHVRWGNVRVLVRRRPFAAELVRYLPETVTIDIVGATAQPTRQELWDESV